MGDSIAWRVLKSNVGTYPPGSELETRLDVDGLHVTDGSGVVTWSLADVRFERYGRSVAHFVLGREELELELADQGDVGLFQGDLDAMRRQSSPHIAPIGGAASAIAGTLGAGFKPTRGTVLMIGGGLLGLISLGLPWATSGLFSATGLQIGGTEPLLVGGLALGAIGGGGLVGFDHTRFRGATTLLGVAVALGLVYGVLRLLDFQSQLSRTLGAYVDPMTLVGIGVWIAFAAGAVILVGSRVARSENGEPQLPAR